MSVTKINGARQIEAGSILNAQQNFGTPSASTDVAIKSYVDSLVQGLSPKPSAVIGTTGALSPANTYANGTSGVGATLTATGVGILTIDGYNVLLNDYVLVKDEASGFKNGLYKCTTQGTAGVAYVLTRAVEMDVSTDFVGAFVFVEAGTVNVSAGFVCSNATAPTVGSTAITFTQFSGAGQITVDSTLTKTGNQISRTAIGGDITIATGSNTATVTKINGVALSGLATGILKNTTTSGVPSIAVAGDFPTLNQNTTGSAGTLTTPRNINGVAFDGSAPITITTASSGWTVSGGALVITSQALNEAKGADVASATTTDLGAIAGNYANVTGTVTITGLGTVQAGTRRIVNFTGILTLTHNATSLILPTGANITTAVGDIATFISLGAGNWVCTGYQRASGLALATGASTYFRSTAVTGTQDSANKVFTIANTLSSGSEAVYINGQLLQSGSSNDYVYNGTTTVTFQSAFTAPASTDVIRVYGNY